MHFPKELKYSKTHEWVRFTDESTAYIGITDYAQDQLGDLVFVNLPEEGDALTAGEPFADVESVKAVSDVNSPVSGIVKQVNGELADAPEKIRTAVEVYTAEEDNSVLPQPQEQFVSRLQQGRRFLIRGARHEIYRSSDEVLFPWWRQVLDFLKEA